MSTEIICAIISVVVALCAIISPVITTIMNNKHLEEMKRMEFDHQDEQAQAQLSRQHAQAVEEFLKYANRYLYSCNAEAQAKYDELYFPALMHIRPDLQGYLMILNSDIHDCETVEAKMLLDRISVSIVTGEPIQNT